MTKPRPSHSHYRSQRRNVAVVLTCALAGIGCRDFRTFDDIIGSPSLQTDSNKDTASGSDSADIATEPNETNRDTGSEYETATETEPPTDCPAALADRLTISSIEVDDDIRYARLGYNLVYLDARIALDITPDGRAKVAWNNQSRSSVFVTPLDENLQRDGGDIVTAGSDIGGLVAHDDGFAVLTLREDTGEDIAVDEEDRPVKAAVLVRYADGEALFAAPLTGTAGLDGKRDYCNAFRGQLSWDGTQYSAYFEARAGVGYDGRMEGIYGDKLVYVDDAGTLGDPPGWSSRCSNITGLLLSSPIAFCQGDGGLYVMTTDTRLQIAEESTVQGYSGGNFGSAVRLPDGGRILVWASRGAPDPMPTHDITMLRLSETQEVIETQAWLTRTPDIDEINVHAAPYGPDHVVVMWHDVHIADTETDCFDESRSCLGTFAGTRIQLYTHDGTPVGEAETIPASPVFDQALGVYPSGDLVWAYANEAPDYSTLPNINNLPAIRTLQVAKLTYCE